MSLLSSVHTPDPSRHPLVLRAHLNVPHPPCERLTSRKKFTIHATFQLLGIQGLSAPTTTSGVRLGGGEEKTKTCGVSLVSFSSVSTSVIKSSQGITLLLVCDYTVLEFVSSVWKKIQSRLSAR